MGYSKRKPYYYLGKSLVDFFKDPVRHLKESNIKESVFEKPYLQGSYPEMHFRMPIPFWPSHTNYPPITGPFGRISDPGGLIRYIFPKPTCSTFGFTGRLECDNTITIEFYTETFFQATYAWSISYVADFDIDLVDVTELGASFFGTSGIKLEVTAEKGAKGTLAIFAEGVSLADQPLIWEATYEAGEARPILFLNNPQAWEETATQKGDVFCGGELSVDCAECVNDPAMAWDYETSGDIIEPNGASVVVAITGLNAPFTWSVSGTGFTLVNEETDGLTNSLNADNTACGSAMITVTGCDGTIATGYVRCTAGQWGQLQAICGSGTGYSGKCEEIVGNRKYTAICLWTGCAHGSPNACWPIENCSCVLGDCSHCGLTCQNGYQWKYTYEQFWICL